MIHGSHCPIAHILPYKCIRISIGTTFYLIFIPRRLLNIIIVWKIVWKYIFLPRASTTTTPTRYAWMLMSGRHLRFNGRVRFGNVRRHRQWVCRCTGISRRSEPVPGRARWRPTLWSNWIAPFNRHKNTHL